MTISYNWLCDYLPEKIEPERLSKILTSIGLEVESLEIYESIKGGLKGLVIGEVTECISHPNADKLKLTKVNIGADEILQIVCGAPNVATGQKVVVARVGATIYPIDGEAITMKIAKIRSVESYGMICAEDEIGIGNSHAGIIILPDDIKPGTPAEDYFKPYSDWIFEIGLTPNRMDAMSHYGVAKDVCAYLTHHSNKEVKPKIIFANGFKSDNNNAAIKIIVENEEACQRYAGISLSNIEIKDSPAWLKNKLLAIGQKPINNVVDITNFILHETGQPLHAFDADEIKGKTIIVKNLSEGTLFTTLDEKERKLSKEDLMICNSEAGMCIAGVFGGLHSSIKTSTKNIFLESAWFNPVNIRETSVRHNLRTDAATRFEKGVDISNAVNVLKRAALMIKEIAGGEISSDATDIYPHPAEKKQVALKYHYLKKLSGKNYHRDAVKRILNSLGFEMLKEGMDEMRIAVPYSKPDVTLPADIVEEILRIDGLDNIEIPSAITISPATETLGFKELLKEKLFSYLAGMGFNEIITNSITNSKYFNDEVLESSVKMINNLSADLNVLRPSMLETGLESVAYNINRKNNNIRFFEFGKIYQAKAVANYFEEEHLCLYFTGSNHENEWREKNKLQDFFVAKGIASSLFSVCGFSPVQFKKNKNTADSLSVSIYAGKETVGTVIAVNEKKLSYFDIKQPVYFVDINFQSLLKITEKQKIVYSEISKFPAVQRDVAFTVNNDVTYESVEGIIKNIKLPQLIDSRLFDVFEDKKLGKEKKSLAISFIFQDEEKTLTDKEIDAMVRKLINELESSLGAEIRK